MELARISLLVAIGLALGCSSQPEVAPARAQEATPAEATPAEATPAEAPVAAPDPSLVAVLRDAAARCEIDDAGDLRGCPGEAVAKQILDAEVAGRFTGPLKIECALLSDADAEVARLSLSRLAYFELALEAKMRPLVDRELFDCLRGQVGAAGGTVDAYTLGWVFAGLAAALELHEEALATLRAQPDRALREGGYHRVWRNAGAMWPQHAQVLAAEADPQLRVELIRGIALSDEFPKDGPVRAALCDTMVRLTQDAATEIQQAAVMILAERCHERTRELLTALRGLLDRKALGMKHLTLLDTFVLDPQKYDPKDVARVTELLTAMAGQTSLDGKTRFTALYLVFQQDAARGRALAKKYRQDPDATMASMSRELMQAR